MNDHEPQDPPPAEVRPVSDYPDDQRTATSPTYSRALITRDRSLVRSILDDGYLCHVAFIAPKRGNNPGGEPVAVPNLYGRVGETIYLHGSPNSRLAKHLESTATYPVCVAVTHVDALVAGRSAFNHAVSYRSAMIHGKAYLVTDAKEKTAGLKALVEQVISGRSQGTREASAEELKHTALVGVRIETATAKVRNGGPNVAPGDEHSKHWAGIIPVRQVYGPPISAPDLETGVVVPDHIRYITEIKNQRNIRFTPPYESVPATAAGGGVAKAPGS
ncbi:pyridoxamine 5'-phosphate oxidase family protein [Saccharothrix obliqua]|uniref:pyridoxamine 5'-phosphate oxidase family protein n=1 Tax=Saccharothrix obliqua TaxID=2861747 RepID=UPI001C5DD8B6|nr:pyridoxamine 5'-phosphate oxidase family protein [Saccharothrix obliqua]MBW4718644.1 pyridoxamine 5'-phosphate oxidase family protein [Saccharothrix obliqua]